MACPRARIVLQMLIDDEASSIRHLPLLGDYATGFEKQSSEDQNQQEIVSIFFQNGCSDRDFSGELSCSYSVRRTR